MGHLERKQQRQRERGRQIGPSMKVDKLPTMKQPQSFSGKIEEFKVWWRQIERYIEYQFSNTTISDRAKIIWLSGHLQGDASRWFTHREEEHAIVHPFVPDTWRSFSRAIQAHFRDDEEERRAEFEMSLLVYKDNISDFLIRFRTLNTKVRVSGPAMRSMVERALPHHLLKELGRMETPQDDADFMEQVRKAGQTHERLIALNKRGPAPTSSKAAAKKPERVRPAAQSSTASSSATPSNVAATGSRWTDIRGQTFRESHKDVSQTLIDSRRNSKTCTRCGKGAPKADGTPSHSWKQCHQDKPVVSAASRGSKRKADDSTMSDTLASEANTVQPTKKAKTASAAKIVEITDSDEERGDYGSHFNNYSDDEEDFPMTS